MVISTSRRRLRVRWLALMGYVVTTWFRWDRSEWGYQPSRQW